MTRFSDANAIHDNAQHRINMCTVRPLPVRDKSLYSQRDISFTLENDADTIRGLRKAQENSAMRRDRCKKKKKTRRFVETSTARGAVKGYQRYIRAADTCAHAGG